MRARIWIFTAVVALALALDLARVSLGIAQTGEDTMRARVAAASNALRGQFDLLDARVAPRAVAMMPDLIEAVRGEDQKTPSRPDERALRAAASVLSPEPDLFAVTNAQGAILSRRGRAVQSLDDSNQLPLSQTASGAFPAPKFASFDGTVYRFAAARVPGAAAAVVVGTAIDDRLTAQLKSQVDADVTLIQGGKVLASSLPQGEDRSNLLRWAASPGPGYGVLPVRLPLVGTELSGKLPQGALRYAVRGALVSLDGGVQAAVTVPASPYLSWLGRYQAFYLLGLSLLVLFGFVWGLLARTPEPVVQPVIAPPPPQPPPEPDDGVVSPPRRAPRTPSLIGADIGEPRPEAAKVRDVPWSPGEGPSGEHKTVEEVRPPALQEVEEESATVAPATGAPESAAAESPAAEAAAWNAPPADASAAAPEWQMPSLPPDALAGEGGGGGPLGFAEPQAEAIAAVGQVGSDSGDAAGSGNEALQAAGAAEGAGAGNGAAEVAAGGVQSEQAVNEMLQASAAGAAEGGDPDEQHWRETYDRFRELKMQLGEPADKLSFERFAAKLRKNREDLLVRHNCKGVRFSVYEKDGRAAIKASAIR